LRRCAILSETSSYKHKVERMEGVCVCVCVCAFGCDIALDDTHYSIRFVWHGKGAGMAVYGLH
jgi:hypothetical protein